jgi:hypothetical protein
MKFRQLIEKENPAVCKTDLPRSRDASSTREAGV